MITIPDLQTALLDLLHEVEGTDVTLMIGGGFGIFLKTDHVRRLGVRTLLHEWPELQLDGFISVLQELFPARAETASQET